MTGNDVKLKLKSLLPFSAISDFLPFSARELLPKTAMRPDCFVRALHEVIIFHARLKRIDHYNVHDVIPPGGWGGTRSTD